MSTINSAIRGRQFEPGGSDNPAGATDAPLVQLTAVRKSYFSNRVETPVLHGIDFSMRRGDFVAIMGQSGSGKSTLMNILGCLDTPTSGQHLLAGHQVNTLSRAELAGLRNRTIGFVFQSFNLLKRMTVLDNVALPLLYANVSRSDARKRALTQLAKVGLTEFAQRQPNQLSGGQQQRVAIARALVADPPLILADEPTGNLDTRTSTDILTALTSLNRDRGQSIILVTHEPDIAGFARRLVRLKDGLVLYDGPAREGLQQLQGEPHETGAQDLNAATPHGVRA
jgi:putative ABC transport system ATP-binding protein